MFVAIPSYGVMHSYKLIAVVYKALKIENDLKDILTSVCSARVAWFDTADLSAEEV